MAAADRTTEEVLARFRSLSETMAPAAPADESARASYLEAASVLHLFRPGELRPASSRVAEGEAALHLGAAIVPALGRQEGGWRTLRLDDRREGLRRLANRTAMRAALGCNPHRPRTDVQRLFEQWVETGRLELDPLGLAELRAARTLAEWGLSDFEGFPAKSEIEAVWRRKSSVGDFEEVAETFVGRERELAVLSEFAGLQPPSLMARARAFFLGQRRPPLVLHGIGGVGKTALVGRFILNYFSDPARARFPFLYIAFDDRAVDPSEPGTILAAAVAQIRQQLSVDAGPKDPAMRSLERSEARIAFYFVQKDRLAGRASQDFSIGARGTRLRKHEAEMFEAFADLLAHSSRHFGQSCGEERSPVLFILDTFEEVEIRPDRHLRSFWQLIDLLGERLPELRLLIVSRTAPTSAALAERKPQTLNLGDLSRADALALLARLGIGDPGVADAVASRIGTNPLTLRLAARVLLDDGADGLAGLRTHQYGFFSVGEEVIRGQLYRRILGHIRDPRVRQIAHPGMVLRRVTPKLIREVLAPVCELGKIGVKEAEDLFAALAREHTLVGRGVGQSLVYRSEVRQPMLRLLAADKPQQVAELHRRGADFHGRSSDEISRAEEIYHLLMLPDLPRKYLESRWTPSLERYLAPSLEELPSEGLIWLASMTRIELPPELLAQADHAEAERFIGREAAAALRHGAYQEALSLLHRSEAAPDSPLSALRVRVLILLGQLDEAAWTLTEAITHFPPFGTPSRLAELHWLHAQLASQRGDDASASAALHRLLPIVRKLASPLALVQVLTRMIQLDGDGAAGLKPELQEALLALDSAERDRERAMLRLALVVLGPEFPECWRRIVPDVGYEVVSAVDSLSDADLAAVGERIVRAVAEAPGDGAARLVMLNPRELPAAAYSVLLKMLGSEATRSAAVKGLWELFRAEGGGLSGIGLAGLDGGRAQWELEEAAALA